MTTRTETGRPTYDPTSDRSRRARATRIASAALKNTGEHRVAEWGFAVLGIALIAAGIGIILVLREHAPIAVCSGLIIAGLLVVPGVVSRLGKGAGVASGYAKAWKESR